MSANRLEVSERPEQFPTAEPRVSHPQPVNRRRAFLGVLGAGLLFSPAQHVLRADERWSGKQGEPRIPRDLKPLYPQDVPPGQVRAKLYELLGCEPVPGQVAFKTGETETTDDGLRLTKLTYRNALGEEVPGVLTMPVDASPRSMAGIVCMPGTSGSVERLVDPEFRRAQPGRRPLIGWGRELARRGFVTLSVTLRGTTARHISSNHWQKHIRFLAPYGRGFMGVMVDEALRAARILSVTDSVDPKRIGLTGMSLGGNAAWYAMACDPTIRAAVPVCGSVGSMAIGIHEGDVERHSSYWYIPHLLRYFDHPRIVAECITPRPFLSIAPTEDEDMPRAGVDEMIRVVKPAYNEAGYPDRFKVHQPPGRHVYKKQYFEWMAEWFRQHC
ncbi:MAG: dienelactone hydrolase family protein [Bryobacterales bacterium]|nr:dienelactone hydrolase family protein [Bryobacterales bacterium]